MSRPSGGFNIRPAMQWLFIAVLAVVAMIYFGMPVRSQDRPAWSAELWAMKGGEELVAAVLSFEPEGESVAPTLVVMCGLHLRYDPGPGADAGIDWTGRTAVVAFDFGTQLIDANCSTRRWTACSRRCWRPAIRCRRDSGGFAGDRAGPCRRPARQRVLARGLDDGRRRDAPLLLRHNS